jgi:adenylate kinase family enzyme
MTMTAALGPRVVIIGASGSGKSTLAKLLGARFGCETIDLDRMHWQDRVGSKRHEGEARAMVAACAAKPIWIIEGVFGWLAEVALPSATALIWLDMPWNVCSENLKLRGSRPGATADEHADFLAWAENYWQRATASSHSGHLALYEGFPGFKRRLRAQSEIAEFH